MRDFIYTGLPARVVFGPGSLSRLSEELDLLEARKALLLCSEPHRGLAERIGELLGDRCVGIYDRAVMHVPIESARQARLLAGELGADCAIALGGGSTIGLGKAIAMESDIPILAIPTTYAGSEMTPIFGITEDGLKRTGRDPAVLPRTVIYDVDLTVTLPVGLSTTSGLNAMAHAAEGIYAADGNPIMTLFATEALAVLARDLPRVAANPENREARAGCQYGAWLCGSVLGHVGMGIHHKLCHTLGGTFDLPHAETHAVVLPHALAYNRDAAPQAMAKIADAIGADDAAIGMHELASSVGAPLALRDLGMPKDGIDRVVELAMQQSYPNPRSLQAEALKVLLINAWEGNVPS